ncbi:MAG: MCE family protein [Pseudonocardia sp.]|nr:MCE family protein [Pseudonocardia sp.]
MSVLALGTTVAVLTGGCGVFSSGLRGVSLPGGADLGDDPYTVSIRFPDVVDLVPQALVKVADVSVGSVIGITVDPQTWNAVVTVAVNRDVRLPANSAARVRTTSLLGEKFVELAAPADGATGTLANGATIPIERAGRAVEVEEVFGALSMLLNGGGIAQIKTISTELNTALDGRTPEIRSLLDNLDTLVGALDDRKGEITRALDGLNRLGATLNERNGQIADALDGIGPGLAELESQRTQLVDMLRSLDRLSGVATNVVNRSQADTVADLRELRPTLQNLAASGQDLPDSLQLLGSFPFTDAAADAFAGDYANLYVRADLDLKDLLDNLARSNQPFPGPDTALLNRLPATAQLLSPLLGSGPQGPAFPLLGPVPTPFAGYSPDNLPSTSPPPATSTPAPAPTTDAPTTEPTRSGGLLGGLLGGGS